MSDKSRFLIDHFDRLAEAPGGVAKLRDLLIQLAVTARLEERCSPVPWTECVIEDCFAPLADGRTLHQGWSPQCEGHPSETEEEWGVLKTTSIQPGEFQPHHNKRLPDSLEPRPHLEVHDGDILITCAGPRVRCGVACLVRTTRSRLMISGKMYRFRVPPTLIDPRYMELFLQSAEVNVAINAMKTGSSESGLNLTHDRFRQLPVRYPPLVEQRRILVKVEELMRLCDKLDAAQREREAIRARLRSSALRLLQVAATPADTYDASIFVLEHLPSLAITTEDLDQTRHVVIDLAIRGALAPQSSSTRLPDPVVPNISIEIPYEIPSDWRTNQLGYSVEIIGGSQPPKSTFVYEPTPGYTRLVQIRDFKSDSNKTYIPTKYATRPFSEDDIMIGRYGPPVFQLLRGLSGSYNVALMKAVPKARDLSKDFLYYLLQESRIHDRVVEDSERTAGQTGVRKPLLESFDIPVPPLADQRRIVAKVDELMVVLDALEASLTVARSTAKNLLDATATRLDAA